MKKYNNWLSSENDRAIFFKSLLNPPAPNERLKQAVKRYYELKRMGMGEKTQPKLNELVG